MQSPQSPLTRHTNITWPLPPAHSYPCTGPSLLPHCPMPLPPHAGVATRTRTITARRPASHQPAVITSNRQRYTSNSWREMSRNRNNSRRSSPDSKLAPHTVREPLPGRGHATSGLHTRKSGLGVDSLDICHGKRGQAVTVEGDFADPLGRPRHPRGIDRQPSERDEHAGDQKRCRNTRARLFSVLQASAL